MRKEGKVQRTEICPDHIGVQYISVWSRLYREYEEGGLPDSIGRKSDLPELFQVKYLRKPLGGTLHRNSFEKSLSNQGHRTTRNGVRISSFIYLHYFSIFLF